MKAHSAEVSKVAHSAGVVYRKVYSGVPVARLLWCQPRGFFFTCSRLFCLFLRRMARASSKLTRLMALRFAMRPAPAMRLPDLIPSWPVWCGFGRRSQTLTLTAEPPLVSVAFPHRTGVLLGRLRYFVPLFMVFVVELGIVMTFARVEKGYGPHAARPNSRKRTKGSLEGCKYWGVPPRGRPSSVGGFG